MSFVEVKQIIVTLIVLVLSITLHEFGHAISADRLGDPTPRREGRISLWPDKHFDLFGFSAMVVSSIVGFGIGWGKPVMVQPRNFKDPRRDMMIVTICGPLMNLALALLFGIPLRFMLASQNIPGGALTLMFFESFVIINLSLMFFNLIPITPLDGSKILSGFLPMEYSIKYERFMAQYGIILLAVMIMTRGSSLIIRPAVIYCFNLILGLPQGSY